LRVGSRTFEILHVRGLPGQRPTMGTSAFVQCGLHLYQRAIARPLVQAGQIPPYCSYKGTYSISRLGPPSMGQFHGQIV
jgi:hypothetical protein